MQNGIWGAHEPTSTFPPFPTSVLQFGEVELVAVACCPILNCLLLCFSTQVHILELFSAGRMRPLSYPPCKSCYLSPRLNDMPHHETLPPENAYSSHPSLNSQNLLLGCYLCPGPIFTSSCLRMEVDSGRFSLASSLCPFGWHGHMSVWLSSPEPPLSVPEEVVLVKLPVTAGPQNTWASATKLMWNWGRGVAKLEGVTSCHCSTQSSAQAPVVRRGKARKALAKSCLLILLSDLSSHSSSRVHLRHTGCYAIPQLPRAQDRLNAFALSGPSPGPLLPQTLV